VNNGGLFQEQLINKKMKENKKTALTYYIIGSALIWAATILACALILKERYTQISVLLASAAATNLLIWGALDAQLKKAGSKGQRCTV
jgi:hypothetical protein